MPLDTKEYGMNDREEFGNDFKEAVRSVNNGYIYIMTTEEIDFCRAADEGYGSDTEMDRLFSQGLEIRVFDEKGETKWFRTGIDKTYRFRRITDDRNVENDSLHWWNESQYLDIDTDRTKSERDIGKIDKDTVYATGGGSYPLPTEQYNDTKIRIRNYLGEDDDTGELYVKDWRLAGFGEWPESTNGGGA